ncbi:MAG: orotate phosphoribosyltransferase [Alphaproteobacteria bacterium GM7ARS4]|nr:orotate phosphoribosyltransferase [Alphaproteobacteria bacterium GM7ARS4]
MAHQQSVAHYLLTCGAVQITSMDTPFLWSSGRKSPIYVDCRRILSYPGARHAIMQEATACLKNKIGRDVLLAGGESAGIPYAAILAESLGNPMIYIRKQSKRHGLNKRIEGHFEKGMHAILIEDQTTDGQSKEDFIRAMRHEGITCAYAFVLFSYETKKLKETMDALGVTLYHLCSYGDVIDYALKHNKCTEEQAKMVNAFIDTL